MNRSLQKRFPDVEPELKRLGIKRTRQTTARLDDTAPLAALRRGITQARPQVATQ